MYKNGWRGGGDGRAQGMVEIQFNGVIDRKGLWRPMSGQRAERSTAQRSGQQGGAGEEGRAEAHMRDVSWEWTAEGQWAYTEGEGRNNRGVWSAAGSRLGEMQARGRQWQLLHT